MSTFDHLLDLQEQICYVQCGHCTTILLVSVPFSSLSMVATVRCGHCTSLLSVNMMKASFLPLHLFADSLSQDDQVYNTKEYNAISENFESKLEVCPEEKDADVDQKELLQKHSPSFGIFSDEEEDDDFVINKRNIPKLSSQVKGLHDVHSYKMFELYVCSSLQPQRRDNELHPLIIDSSSKKMINCVNTCMQFREEIRRLKASYPKMTHKQAFSAAAKNVNGKGRERAAARGRNNFMLLRSGR
ncbi:hypothetical protein RJ640_016119, partial [Escallonia rubra]